MYLWNSFQFEQQRQIWDDQFTYCVANYHIILRRISASIHNSWAPDKGNTVSTVSVDLLGSPVLSVEIKSKLLHRTTPHSPVLFGVIIFLSKNNKGKTGHCSLSLLDSLSGFNCLDKKTSHAILKGTHLNERALLKQYNIDRRIQV